MNNEIYNDGKQVIFNALLGAALSLSIGSLGVHLVRYLQGQSFHGIDSKHPLITCTKVVVTTLPLFYLYGRHLRKKMPLSIHISSFELISFATSLTVIKPSHTKVTPLLSLALVLTHLSTKIFMATEVGHDLLGIKF